MNIVLDTNCLLMSLSRRSRYYPIWRNFVDGKYSLCITNEILTEYEEILTQKIGAEIASNVNEFLTIWLYTRSNITAWEAEGPIGSLKVTVMVSHV